MRGAKTPSTIRTTEQRSRDDGPRSSKQGKTIFQAKSGAVGVSETGQSVVAIVQKGFVGVCAVRVLCALIFSQLCATISAIRRAVPVTSDLRLQYDGPGVYGELAKLEVPISKFRGLVHP